jgi:hypothetical protein
MERFESRVVVVVERVGSSPPSMPGLWGLIGPWFGRAGSAELVRVAPTPSEWVVHQEDFGKYFTRGGILVRSALVKDVQALLERAKELPAAQQERKGHAAQVIQAKFRECRDQGKFEGSVTE